MNRIVYAGLVLAMLTASWVAGAQDAAPPAPQPAPAAEGAAPGAPPETPAAPSPFASDDDKVSYVIGSNMGGEIGKLGFTLNVDMLKRGFDDASAGKASLISDQDKQKAMMEFSSRMRAKQMEEQKKAAAENIEKANAFLEKNKAEPGVITLPSGLQYKVLTEGTGEIPKETDRVEVNYKGTLLDGTEFDSSFKRNKPFTTAVKGGIIQGWQEALKLMKVGSKWQLFVPPALGYGERGNRGIPPNSVLIFEIELLRIVPPEEAPQKPGQNVQVVPAPQPAAPAAPAQ